MCSSCFLDVGGVEFRYAFIISGATDASRDESEGRISEKNHPMLRRRTGSRNDSRVAGSSPDS